MRRMLTAAGAYQQALRGSEGKTGIVTASVANGMITLKVSDDFVIPDTPTPNWQAVDSKGSRLRRRRLAGAVHHGFHDPVPGRLGVSGTVPFHPADPAAR